MRTSTITGLVLGSTIALAAATAMAATRRSKKRPGRNYFIYRVKSGDTVSALGLRFFGDAKKWPAISLESSNKTSSLAEQLPIDASLRVPCRWYTVSAGDTLAKISASTLGDAGRWKRIYEANREELPDPNKLEVGRELAIPDAGIDIGDQKAAPAAATSLVSVGGRPFDLLGATRAPQGPSRSLP